MFRFVRNFFLIIVFLFFICTVLYFCFFSEDSEKNIDFVSPLSLSTKKYGVEVEKEIAVASEIEETSSRRSEFNIAVVASWFNRHGIGRDSLAAYEESYSNDQLEEFISNGDIIAADVLASRYIHAGELGKAFEIADKGIVLGSYNAIRVMANQFPLGINEDDSDEERRAKKENLIQYFSYLKLLQLRGGEELFSSQGLREYYLGRFAEIYGDTEPLSAAQYRLIDEQAEALYASYEKRRQEMGWGPFDNDTAREVNKAFLD